MIGEDPSSVTQIPPAPIANPAMRPEAIPDYSAAIAGHDDGYAKVETMTIPEIPRTMNSKMPSVTNINGSVRLARNMERIR